MLSVCCVAFPDESPTLPSLRLESPSSVFSFCRARRTLAFLETWRTGSHTNVPRDAQFPSRHDQVRIEPRLQPVDRSHSHVSGRVRSAVQIPSRHKSEANGMVRPPCVGPQDVGVGEPDMINRRAFLSARLSGSARVKPSIGRGKQARVHRGRRPPEKRRAPLGFNSL